MTPESLHAAFLELAAFVEQRQLAQNRELWERQVSRVTGGRTAGPAPEALERQVRLFHETERGIAHHADCLSQQEALQWRVIRSFFDPYRAPAQFLVRMTNLLHRIELSLSQRAPRAKILPVNRHKRWRCWRGIGNDAARQAAWNACITADPQLGEPFAELVDLRNEVARALGYADFFEYRLGCDGWIPADFDRMLDEIDRATSAPYERARTTVDEELARLWKPFPAGTCWQYGDPWVQTAPAFLPNHPARWIRPRPELLVQRTFAGLGWTGKYFRQFLPRQASWFPSAFCLHLNRGADVRIAANLGADVHSLNLLLHEAGHAVWFAHLDPRLPFLLRTPAHPLLFEGFSMLMQRLPFIPSWVRATRPGRSTGVLRHERDLRRADWIDRLFFTRWSLALIRFERAVYAGGGAADLQSLYWSMVKRHQGLEMPPGREECLDYLSKHHLITHPASYHYYLLGMCFAAQLAQRLAGVQGHDTDPLDLDLTGRSSVLGLPTTASLALGEFLREQLFAPGADCEDPFSFAAKLCGQPLSTTAFLEDLARLERMS